MMRISRRFEPQRHGDTERKLEGVAAALLRAELTLETSAKPTSLPTLLVSLCVSRSLHIFDN